MAKLDTKIVNTMEILLDYKKGLLTLAEAKQKFISATGLQDGIAENFIKGMSRDNIISLQAKKKILNQEETDDDRAG
jgi:hypothetical protein